jgi:magnesium chelatase family protein
MHVEVPRLPYEVLRATAQAPEGTSAVAARVLVARERQQERGALNARLDASTLQRSCALGIREHGLLENASRRLGLSARACHRVQRIARTIADLGGQDGVGVAELSEAIGYRRLDREPLVTTGQES